MSSAELHLYCRKNVARSAFGSAMNCPYPTRYITPAMRPNQFAIDVTGAKGTNTVGG